MTVDREQIGKSVPALVEALRELLVWQPQLGARHPQHQAAVDQAREALAAWEQQPVESIRSPLDETPAKPQHEAPTGLEPVFQSAELKADR